MDQIRLGRTQIALEAGAVGSTGYVESVLRQGGLNGDADDLTVVDDENPGGTHLLIVRFGCSDTPPPASPRAGSELALGRIGPEERLRVACPHGRPTR